MGFRASGHAPGVSCQSSAEAMANLGRGQGCRCGGGGGGGGERVEWFGGFSAGLRGLGLAEFRAFGLWGYKKLHRHPGSARGRSILPAL